MTVGDELCVGAVPTEWESHKQVWCQLRLPFRCVSSGVTFVGCWFNFSLTTGCVTAGVSLEGLWYRPMLATVCVWLGTTC